jgi:hypothetical protein
MKGTCLGYVELCLQGIAMVLRFLCLDTLVCFKSDEAMKAVFMKVHILLSSNHVVNFISFRPQKYFILIYKNK